MARMKKCSRDDVQPVLLDGLEESQADPGGVGDLPQGNPPKLSFSLEFLTEGCHWQKL